MSEETLPDLNQLWRSRRFQKFCDIMRIALFIFVALIMAYIVINIEYVKTVASPCHVCMEKTEATCMVLPPNTECLIIPKQKEKIPIYDLP